VNRCDQDSGIGCHLKPGLAEPAIWDRRAIFTRCAKVHDGHYSAIHKVQQALVGGNKGLE
jgi:hypothetical protein